MNRCDHCGEKIAVGEACGHIAGASLHHECATRLVAGSIGHQLGLCSCPGNPGIYDDPPGLTVRQSAEIAMRFFAFRERFREAIESGKFSAESLNQMGVLRAFRDFACRERPPTVSSIVCPKCKRRSYNINDVQNRYCGACHEYHDTMDLPPKPGGPT